MEGLTAKVFRTYNASITLQQQLKELTARKCCHDHTEPHPADGASVLAYLNPRLVLLFLLTIVTGNFFPPGLHQELKLGVGVVAQR